MIENTLEQFEPIAQVVADETASKSDEVLSTDYHLYDIVDDLMDKDLLGLLLSTSHFQRYCALKAETAPDSLASALMTIASSVAISAQFQNDALQQFSGIYIPECRVASKQELAARLDEKLKQFFGTDFTPEAQVKMSQDIENAWKYRLATQGIRF